MLRAGEIIGDVEQALIGAVLTDPKRFPPLLPEEFFVERHRVIWRAIIMLHGEGRTPDLVLVANRLRVDGQLEDAGGVAALAAAVDAGVFALQVDNYAERIREEATRRQMRRLGEELRVRGLTPEEVETRLAEVPRPMSVRAFDGRALWDRVQVGWLEAPILLGLPETDRRARLMPGDLVVVGGRTSHGKTAFCISAAVRMIADGTPVAYYSLETPAEAIWRRAVACRAKVSLAALKSGGLTPTEFQVADETAAWLAGRPFVVRDVRFLGGKRVARVLEALIREEAAVLVLDHVQEIVTEGENRALELGAFFARLKELALREGKVVLAAAQLSRATERHRGLPVLADLKESGGIEERADIVLLLHHWAKAGSKEHAPEDLEVIVAKNRDGETGRATVRFEVRYGLVESARSRPSAHGSASRSHEELADSTVVGVS